MFQQYLHRCTEKVIEQINIAIMEFIDMKRELFTPEMLLLGMLGHENSRLPQIFEEAGQHAEDTRARMLDMLYDTQEIGTEALVDPSGQAQIKVTPEVEELFKIALEVAAELGDKYISEDSLYLSMYRLRYDTITRILEQSGLDEAAAKAAIESLRNGSTITDRTAESKMDVLKMFTTDLTEMARKGQLDPVVGREEEIMRVIEVLSRRKKNNPILIGYPGVGKTVIVEGLANMIAEAEVPETLLNKRILQLDMAEIVAGAKFKGEFEERIKMIKDEIIGSAGQIILFIDEIHTVVSSGDPGGISASNMLKPALAKGQLQCIGATTFQEYKQYIEVDKALARRFQPITVDEPSVDETVEILEGLREKYEEHHSIRYDNEAISTAAKLAEKYISDRFLPDKAIDLIDEAGARKHLQLIYVQPDIQKLEKEKQKLRDEQMRSYDKGDFENVALLQQQISVINQQMEKIRTKKEKKQKPSSQSVTVDDVAQVITRWTGIPAQRMLTSEKEKLLKMEQHLHQRVIGQDVAVAAVSAAIRRNRAGMRETNRPIGAFLFLGPTGVGKTELAKALAEFLMDDQQKIIRLDMSEYMEAHTVSRLIGSPPGYVGYGEGGQLTEMVKRNPYSVVLLDEVEKAHPNIFNVMLQIFDEGHITDAQGFKVSFKNTVVIGTSNIGGQEIARDVKRIGFETFKEDEKTYDDMKNTVMSDVRKFFKPEFINRLDDIIVFHSLTKENFKEIVDLELGKLQTRLLEEGIEVQFTDGVRAMLLKYGFSEIYGARPLKREIEKRVENPLSIMLMKDELKPGKSIILDENNDELVVQK